MEAITTQCIAGSDAPHTGNIHAYVWLLYGQDSGTVRRYPSPTVIRDCSENGSCDCTNHTPRGTAFVTLVTAIVPGWASDGFPEPALQMILYDCAACAMIITAAPERTDTCLQTT